MESRLFSFPRFHASLCLRSLSPTTFLLTLLSPFLLYPGHPSHFSFPDLLSPILS